MLDEESRIPRVNSFEGLQEEEYESSNLLQGVMTIANEVDSQLRQMVESYLEAPR